MMNAIRPAGTARAAWALALCAALLGLLPVTVVAAPAGAPTAQPDSGSWRSLTPGQRQILAPLASQWPTMDDSNRSKWINVAERYPRLSPAAQARMQERMTQWARLPAQQRGEARLRFQNTRQLSPQERQQKWEAYQALPAEARQDLARQARRKQQPVVLPDAEPGPREANQQARDRRRGQADGKTNLVPNPRHATPPRRAVAPTLIKAGPGATTTLITQPPAPPLHQHTGLPKITATRGFVDPQTLLPRKGPQGAAMTPVPASAP